MWPSGVTRAPGTPAPIPVQVVQAATVVQCESLFQDWRLDRRAPAAIADDPAGQDRRAGERVDIAQRVQRPVVQPEQRRLRAVVEQHTSTPRPGMRWSYVQAVVHT